MNNAVLVRSTLQHRDLVAWVVMGFVLVGAGGLYWLHGDEGLGAVLMTAGVVIVPCGIAAMFYRIRRRRWVRDTGSGFVFFDRAGEREFTDDQIVGMALNFQRNYAEGVLKSVRRRCLVWIASDADLPEQLTLETTIAADRPDPLSGLITRIGNHLFELANQDLETGQVVRGEGWTWQNGELTVCEKKEVKSTRVDEIAAVARVDRHLKIWRSGEEIALAQLPEESANLYVLERLLTDRLSQLPAGNETPSPGSLGRVIFERAPSKDEARMLLLLCIGMIAAAVVSWCALGAVEGETILAIWLVFFFLILAVLCAMQSVRLRRSVFRCHQFGVFRAGFFGERSLHYNDVEAFTYKAVRGYFHGGYVNSYFTLQFHPRTDQARSAIRYAFDLPNGDEELNRLRDEISRMIAERMLERLKSAEPVDWTPGLRFLGQGLEYSAGWLRRQSLVAPYTSIFSHKVEQGVFYLWVSGNKKPIVRIQTSERNFFPGFFLLMTLWANPAALQHLG